MSEDLQLVILSGIFGFITGVSTQLVGYVFLRRHETKVRGIQVEKELEQERLLLRQKILSGVPEYMIATHLNNLRKAIDPADVIVRERKGKKKPNVTYHMDRKLVALYLLVLFLFFLSSYLLPIFTLLLVVFIVAVLAARFIFARLIFARWI